MCNLREDIFFSVVIPLYNKEKYIKGTLQSVLAQTYTNFEVIIVNDGSTDKSLEKIYIFPQDKIRVITIENSGVSVARNVGIKAAKGDFIVLLDADDYWYPNHISNFQASILKFPSEQVFCNNYKIKYAVNNLYQPVFSNLNLNGGIEKYSFFETSYINSIITSTTVCIRARVLKSCLFDEQILSGEDTDLWIRLGLQYPVVFHPEVTAIYNKFVAQSLSKSDNIDSKFIFTQKFLEAEQTNAALRKFMDLNRFSVLLVYIKKQNRVRVKLLKSQIDSKNLNNKQRLLLQCPAFVLISLHAVKSFLSKNFGINFSVFK